MQRLIDNDFKEHTSGGNNEEFTSVFNTNDFIDWVQ